MFKPKHSWLIALLLLGACKRNAVYQHTITLPAAQWPTTLLPQFQFTIQEEAQPYDIYLQIDSTPSYPFHNLHVNYYLKDAASKILQEAMRTYTLFDTKTGKPLGNGWGTTKKHTVALLVNHQFSQPGTYTLQLAQFMRTHTLAGLSAVSIKIIPSAPLHSQHSPKHH